MITNVKNKREYLSKIASYLLELGIPANKTVSKDELSSVDKVDEVRAGTSNLVNLPAEKFKVDFSEKDDIRFGSYIQGLYDTNNEQVYLWTSKTNICGLYKVGSIKDVNFSFPFGLNDEGIIVFLSADLKDKLLLDFSIDPNGNKVVEVEAQGLNWPNVKY
ncbi:hypothetical protein [Marinomonas sp. THO17]|uniref:hypothetical protein n=1 Tax=Marinomonas sp. THO17 TaxID=3149048 RepID=UPI00336BD417